MKFIFSVFIFLFIPNLYSQEINFDWNKTFGDINRTIGLSIAADSSGNIYTCGKFSGVFQENDRMWGRATEEDGYLLKMDSLGNIIWFKQFTSNNNAVIISLAIDHSNKIYVIGNYENTVTFDTTIYTNNTDTIYSSNMFISKFSENGQLIWAKNTGAVQYTGNRISIDYDNNILLSGFSIDINLFNEDGPISTLDSSYIAGSGGHYYWDYFHPTENFMAKYDPNGQLLWIKNAGEFNYEIIPDKLNNIIITGNMYHDTYFDNILVPSIGFETTYLAKYSPQGSLQWVKTSGGSSNYNCGYALAIDTNNNIYQGGQICGNNVQFNDQLFFEFSGSSAFLAKYNQDGTFQWAHEIGTPRGMMDEGNFNRINSIIIDQNQELILTGFFLDNLSIANTRLISEGAFDLLLLKYSLSGTAIKAGQFTKHGWVSGNKICLGPHNKLFYTGFSSEQSWNSRDPIYTIVGRIDKSIPTSPLSVQSLVKQNFNIYPNPNNGYFTINFSNISSENKHLIIYNSSGIIIKEQIINQVFTPVQLNIPGIYIVEIQTLSSTSRKKVIIN
jgi:hypothetical protein